MKMGKICNVFSMLKILESGRKYTVNELSELIEVSPRMIKFYKVELEKAGIYIETERGPYGGYIYN
ncbi:MAG: HTH domain-containing protein, partial [Tenericutes bacterium]|nr:HTH domain-containing protein [Mycoplasmatota bacterium]